VARSAFSDQLALRAALLRENGLDYAFERVALPEAPGAKAATAGPAAASEPSVRSTPPGGGADPVAALEALRERIGDCRRCRLCEKRTQIVFGVGNPKARLMFVGEGPGAEEDRQGEPFVGRAGQLLTDIITKGMGLKRSDVYIANVVKCRPPDNRVPEPDEMAACIPFLEAQIEAIRPEVIVALGATAVQGLLGVKVQITKFRGEWTNFKGTPLMPTFHPSYLLRNPAAKKEVWIDIQTVMKKLGMEVPKKA
jgi:uracil-DNA glycosylase family 4